MGREGGLGRGASGRMASDRVLEVLSRLPRILIVEDDPAIRSLLKAAFGREAVDVDLAPNGADALELTRTRSYAVILLDLLMPRMNGFEFLEAFSPVSPKARPLVIVVSAFDDSLLAKVGSHDVHAIIRKPFDVPWLIDLVRDLAVAWSMHHVAESSAPVIGSDAPPEVRP